MYNRLTQFFVQPDGRWAKEEEFFVVSHNRRFLYVTRETGERIVRQLHGEPAPEWIRFTDLNGANVSLRASMIEAVFESTFAQRAAHWQFLRTRRTEYRQYGCQDDEEEEYI